MTEPYVLIPYYSASGSVASLALYIAKGVEHTGVEARVRRIPPIGRELEGAGPIAVDHDDLIHCSGLIVGSPTRFGQMAASVRHWWDQTGDIWYSGQMVDKPGAVFTSSGSMHGGQESTLLGMLMPMLHHGMVVMGVPYSVTEVGETKTGGGPYGASLYAGADHAPKPIDADEKAICEALGARVAQWVKQGAVEKSDG